MLPKGRDSRLAASERERQNGRACVCVRSDGTHARTHARAGRARQAQRFEGGDKPGPKVVLLWSANDCHSTPPPPPTADASRPPKADARRPLPCLWRRMRIWLARRWRRVRTRVAQQAEECGSQLDSRRDCEENENKTSKRTSAREKGRPTCRLLLCHRPHRC